MNDSTHLSNAPLIRSELAFSWGDKTGNLFLDPSSLRRILDRKNEFEQIEYEWLVPKDRIKEFNGIPFFRASFNFSDVHYDVTLSEKKVEIGCDNTYQEWSAFQDVARAILSSLQTQEDGRDLKNEVQVSLRYIDAFTEEMRKGLKPTIFLEEKLGIKVTMPSSVRIFHEVTDDRNWFMAYHQELHNKIFVDFAVGEAELSIDEKAAIVDITVNVTSSEKDLFASSNDLHSTADNIFFELIAPVISDLS